MDHLLYVDTAMKIEEEINENVLKVGDKLPSERELTIRYQVSRNVVRQAMTILREKGMIEVQPGKGAYVTNPKDMMLADTLKRLVKKYDTSFSDIMEVRIELEKSIITSAVKKATSQDIEGLKRIYNLMEQKKRFVNEYSEEDMNFHIELAKATHNKLFVVLARSFFDLTEKSFFTITDYTNSTIDIIHKAQEQHWRLIDAIETRNPDLAVKTIKEHMDLFKEEIELLESEGLI